MRVRSAALAVMAVGEGMIAIPRANAGMWVSRTAGLPRETVNEAQAPPSGRSIPATPAPAAPRGGHGAEVVMAALDPFMNAHPPVHAELPNVTIGWHLLGPWIFRLSLRPSHQVMSLTRPWRSHGTKVWFATRVREVLRCRTCPLTASYGYGARHPIGHPSQQPG